MSYAWKVLIPLALANLVCVMVVKEFGGSPWLPTALSVGLFSATALSAARPVKAANRSTATAGHPAVGTARS